MVEMFEEVLELVGYSVNTKRKRHLVGGALLSLSFLFGGLAVTIMTMKGEEHG